MMYFRCECGSVCKVVFFFGGGDLDSMNSTFIFLLNKHLDLFCFFLKSYNFFYDWSHKINKNAFQ